MANFGLHRFASSSALLDAATDTSDDLLDPVRNSLSQEKFAEPVNFASPLNAQSVFLERFSGLSQPVSTASATTTVSFSIDPVVQQASEGSPVSFRITIHNPDYASIGSYGIYFGTNATADHAATSADYRAISSLEHIVFSQSGAQYFDITLDTYFDSLIEGTEYFAVDLYDYQKFYLAGSEKVFSITDVPPDDYSADTDTTGEVIPGGNEVLGSIEKAGDRDWFAVNLTKGWTYDLAVNSGSIPQPGPFLADTYLRLYDSLGSFITSDDDSGPGSSAALTFKATYTGTYYLSAADYGDNETGTYRVSVSAGDPPQPPTTFTISNETVSEGDTLYFQLSIQNAYYDLTPDYLVYYKAEDGTATAPSDYAGVPNYTALHFTADSDQTILIPVQTYVDSNGQEGDETFSLGIFDYNEVFLTSGTGTIQDVPPPPSSLAIAATSADKDEGSDGGVTEFTFTVTRTGNAQSACSVKWVLGQNASPAADAATDFSGATSGTLTWAAGDSSAKTITLNVVADTYYEGFGLPEHFTVSLRDAAGAVVGNALATGEIRNDDAQSSSSNMTGADVIAIAEQHIGQNYFWHYDNHGVVSKSPAPGATYVLMTNADLADANYAGPWDCAEFVTYCVFRAYNAKYGLISKDTAGQESSAGQWLLDGLANLRSITNDVARWTPGAILVEETAHGTGQHVAISMGDGKHIIEANIDWNPTTNTFYSDPLGVGDVVSEGAKGGAGTPVDASQWDTSDQDTPKGVDIGDVKISSFDGVAWHAFELPGVDYATPAVLSTDPGGVTADLTTGIASGPSIGTISIAGASNLVGGDGGDSLTGNGGVNLIAGGGGNDFVVASGGDDIIIGGDGAGDDNYEGGPGIDTVVYTSTTLGVIVDLGKDRDQAVGPEIGVDQLAGIENIIGGAGDDHLSGDAHNNILAPGSGNDVVDGRGGKDTIDYSDATAGVSVDLSFDQAEVIGADQGQDTLRSIENVRGSEFDDWIFGNTKSNMLFGNGGNDGIYLKGRGDDVVFGGTGDDIIGVGRYLTSTDRIDGGSGNDILSLQGDYSAGVLFAPSTIKDIESIALVPGYTYNLTLDDANVRTHQTLTINGYYLGIHDQLIFSAAAESDASLLIYGGQGDDQLVGGGGADTISAGDGADTVVGGGGNDLLYGGIGDDIMKGSGGADRLLGEDGNDDLEGGSGKDVFYGGLGADTLAGGPGSDIFVFSSVQESASGGYDRITDFRPDQDYIDLWFVVAAVDPTVTTDRALNLGTVLDAAHLGAHDAVLANIGAKTFLVVDANGTAGYQTGADLLIQMNDVPIIYMQNFIYQPPS